MKIGIIISSNDPETVWNAFRYGEHVIKAGDDVKVFLTGPGVEAEHISTVQFPVKGMMKNLEALGGKVLCCGTCAKKIRGFEPQACPVGGLKDMHAIIKESDRVVTF
ncbi:DsrE family protein [Candidatus Aquicultor secundus]|uniref:Sulfur reduction protein DsrE n=1 Tax=Candidatus Aquicultor secundus TaxID=1973895 RepID=A0A2M7T8R6_9ACTN|nr:DsrE family protein [Candidatus Aquicultor secundus]NCO66556.1 DsrE family protein [Solirubrobacter sp.]PIU27133.1 MAG: sulfur reduction protein DsrE [Candidatus Aquicultor secundus]PIZ40312.1 MAG: sulfur reduction protein DsrE [Candidatus Aquicultor secundus]